ncbi:baeRF7 domain-containing protein [Mucilaginibacter arboris]|uniref:Uncharacterized protein n=1 Tax=Mucilaginibacter arboris TaxID=2682090 RepID=A0A7K1SZR9_9SPHI|nr:hypothetical protein [Mucilaginibacter arboris]MVN22812.1 hypothetical protein [Mucilaginibacter arboris]
MELLSKEEFAELANYQSEPCVSIFIPTHRSGVEVNEKQDIIVLKNQLQEAQKQLHQKGMAKDEAAQFLRQGFDLLNHETFWNNQLEGLALFIAKDYVKTLTLPLTVKQELFINTSFYISPLMPVLTSNEQFYMLVFSKHVSHFYLGDAFGMQELEIAGLPQGVGDVIHFEEKDKNQLFRAGGTAPGQAASLHGHDSGLADDKEYLTQYIKELDQTLWTEVLANEHKPLILAAVDNLIGLYRQNSHYKHIAEEAVIGNYEREDKLALWEKAREKLAPYFKAVHNGALQNYYNQIATPLTSSIPETVIPASYYSRISDLFVQKDVHIWGTFNEKDNKLNIHQEKQEGDECLINKAVVKTVLNGGAVHILEAEKMPKESVIAAFMRF